MSEATIPFKGEEDVWVVHGGDVEKIRVMVVVWPEVGRPYYVVQEVSPNAWYTDDRREWLLGLSAFMSEREAIGTLIQNLEGRQRRAGMAIEAAKARLAAIDDNPDTPEEDA